eukprot:gene16516-18167_t
METTTARSRRFNLPPFHRSVSQDSIESVASAHSAQSNGSQAGRAAARAVDQRRPDDDVDNEAINVLETSGVLKDTGRRPTTILVRASQVSVGNKDILDVLRARGFKTRCIQQTQNRDYLVTLDSAASKKNLVDS